MTIDVRDLENIWKSLNAAIERNAFEADELTIINPLNQKLKAFLDQFQEMRKNVRTEET